MTTQTKPHTQIIATFSIPEQKQLHAFKVIDLTPQGVVLLDQRQLPQQLVYQTVSTPQAMTEAITTMVVRGAPAIGIAGAYGVVLAAQIALNQGLTGDHWLETVKQAATSLRKARPTAVNLMWAIDRMLATLANCCQTSPLNTPETINSVLQQLVNEAVAIFNEDVTANLTMATLGASLLKKDSRLQTHCNAGALATAGYGTALGVIREAHQQGKCSMVYADETRPRLQGSQLTAWELSQDNIPVTIVSDSMSGHLMQQGLVDSILVGADRITANGDVANKIGTYTLALVAKAHNVPFYVVAPTSTFDLTLSNGQHIPIEERDPKELTHISNTPVAPKGINTFNPAFDVTPAHYITAIICEKGILYPPFNQSIKQTLG
jgi:methylthioribose-1-phosphate isomerase